MSKYTVIVSKRADEMLIRHARFLARVRVSAAKRMISEFKKVLDDLECNPYLFAFEDEYDLPPNVYRKALFSKWYKAIFSIDRTTVYLDTVLDCRQENAKYKPER